MPRQSEAVAAEVLRQLRAGTAPWIVPWKPGEAPPRPINAVTARPYHGINELYLQMVQPSDDPRWCTYVQAQQAGAQVNKGAHSNLIMFPTGTSRQTLRAADGKPVLDSDGKEQKIDVQLERPRFMYAHVFHASDITGLPPWERKVVVQQEWQAVERAEQLIKASGADIHHDQLNRAFYRPSSDEIHLPHREQFATAEDYYSTALHELGHWTGHESRLNRPMGPRGTTAYAQEELCAEIGSYMLNTKLGLGHDPSQHMSYIDSWIKLIENDALAIHRAAAEAVRIMDHVEQRLLAQENVMSNTKEEKTWLDVPRAEKDEAKPHGARWDAQAKRWYAPAGTDLTPLKKWLPAPAQDLQEKAPEYTVPATHKKTWLTVPYVEKEQAKAAGAKWDSKAKRWFAAPGADLTELEQWSVDPKVQPRESDARTEFMAFAAKAGLLFEDGPEADGKLHRVAVQDATRGKKDGAYVLHLDDIPSGWIQNFKTGYEATWRSTDQQLTPAQMQVFSAEVAAKRATRKAEIEAGYDDTAAKLMQEWRELWPAHGQNLATPHPYLANKGLGTPSEYGAMVDPRNRLVVPLTDIDGKLWSLQRISPTGFKEMAKNAKAQGCMHVITPFGETMASGPAINVTTGFGTGAAIHTATGESVVCTMSDNNLLNVASAIRDRHPDAPILVWGDDDRGAEAKGKQNSGRTYATSVAEAIGGVALFPTFAADDQTSTDFADMHQHSGPRPVRDAGSKARAQLLGTAQEKTTALDSVTDFFSEKLGRS